MFVHLRGRGTYSMLEGIGSHADIISLSQSYGQDAIALTDLYGMYGAVDFYNSCKSASLKPLLGVELPYTSVYSSLPPKKNAIEELGTVTLLAKTKVGYHKLLQIISESYAHNPDGLPCVDAFIIQSFHDDVIVLMGGLRSVPYRAMGYGQSPKDIYEYIDSMVDVFGADNVIIDITAQSYDHYPILATLHPVLMQYAEKRGLRVVTSSGYLYPRSSQQSSYETALAIKDNKKIYDPDARKIQGSHHVLSEEEVRDILVANNFDVSMIDEMVENTVRVAEMCNVKIELGQVLFPNYDTPEDIQLLYAQYKEQLLQN